MNTKVKIIPFALSIILLTNCWDMPIIGNGIIGEETRQLPAFTELVSNGSFDVHFEYGDTYEARIVCESNLLPYIETSVFDNRLDIRTPIHVTISSLMPIDVYVKSPSIRNIVLAGSGEVTTDTITEPSLGLTISGSGDIYSKYIGTNLEVVIAGSGDLFIEAECQDFSFRNNASGDLTIQGTTDESTYTITGSGDVDAFGFPCREANVTISGSGDLYVNVSDFLKALLTGSGDIYYIGHPSITPVLTGSGNLIDKN